MEDLSKGEPNSAMLDNVPDDAPEQERLRRQRMISDLARRAGDVSIANAGGPRANADQSRIVRSPPARRHGTWSRVVLAALVLVVGTSGVLAVRWWQSGRNPSGAASMVLKIIPRANDLGCLNDIQWAPRGHLIALLGNQRACPPADVASGRLPGLVNIYDAMTGRLANQLHPDDKVIGALHPQMPSSVLAYLAQAGLRPDDAFAIRYTTLIWSPDGSQIAMPFALDVPTGPPVAPQSGMPLQWPGTTTLGGLLVMDTNGGTARVLSDLDGDLLSPTWDLKTGMKVVGATTTDSSGGVLAGFTWTSTGALTSQTIHSVTAAQPIGTPVGGSSFSVWQPGDVSLDLQPDPASPSLVIPGAYLWQTSLMAWSPDGRYLRESLYVQGLLYPSGRPAPTAQALHQLHLQTLPKIPVHDAAFQRLLADMPASALAPGLQSYQVAWRPDGMVLAAGPAEIPDDSGTHVDPRRYTVTLYDCHTGKQLARLVPSASPADVLAQGVPTLRWSPDGSQLLDWDASLATVTIWGLGALP